VLKTIRIQTDDYLIGFDPDVANLLAFNLVDSIDGLAKTQFDAAGTETYVGQATEGAITATDILTANEARQKYAELSAANVQFWSGSLYAAIVHPHVSYDLRAETGDGAWVAPHQYVDTMNIYNNEFGTFAGFRWVETSRANLNTDGGSGTVDTYTNYFLGRQAIAKAESIAPHMVQGPVTDKLRRFVPLGWHTYVGWNQFRAASLERLLSASSIGAN
jgi:N4-gp56 family major capsid protein